MSIAGKNSINFVKKDLSSQKNGAIAFKTLMFAHKASGGESSFSLSSLSTPSEMAGFVNPSPTELASAHLQLIRKNLKIISSVRGELIDYLSYTVNSDTTIAFTDSFGTALADEIFVGKITPVTETGNLVADVEFILETGSLAAAATDIVVGKSFKTNLNSAKQLGAVMVILDGQTLLRNTGNATASVSADGDYQEVDNGFGSSTLIRLNAASPSARTYIVVSTATTVIAPDGSLRDEVQMVQGQLNTVIATVADLAGVPTTNFQATPSQPALAQFGNRLITAESKLTGGTVPATPSASTIASGKVGYVVEDKSHVYSNKVSLTTNVFANIAQISLDPGTWEIDFNCGFEVSGSASQSAAVISINSGNTSTDHVIGDNMFNGTAPLPTSDGSISITKYIVRPTVTTTYYGKARQTHSSTANGYGRMTAVQK